MTQEEKRIKLAEAAGFTDIMLPMGFHQQMSDEKSKKCGGRWRFEIPNYFEDLNAVHELEELVWIDRYRYDYNNNLDRVVSATPAKGHGSKVGPWFYEGTKARRATAAERCEAIGLTLNLW
jgi:hypothetical protein